MNNEIQKIKEAVALCNTRDALLSTLDEYNEVIDAEYRTPDEFKEFYLQESGPKTFFIVLSAIVSVVVSFPLALLLGMIVGEVNVFVSITQLVFIIVGAVLLYSLALKRLYFWIKRDFFEEYAGDYAQLQLDMPGFIKERDATAQELANHESLMMNEDVCIIPRNYWDNANFLYALILNKRATDLVSAINKFEDIMHQKRVESLAQQTLEQQELARQAAEIAAENSAIAAENARVAAIQSSRAAYYSQRTWYES